MTPHGILDGMSAIESMVGDRLEDYFDVGVWNTSRILLADLAVDFDFRGAIPETSHVEFANDLIDRDLFRLPFAVVMYRANALPETAIVAMQGGNDYRLKFVTFGPVKFENGDSGYAPLLTLALTNGPCASARIDWKSVTRSNHRSRKTGREWEEQDYHEASDKVLNFVLGGTTLLMSKDVETVTVPAPSKLNKARERKGRIPIRDGAIVMASQPSALLLSPPTGSPAQQLLRRPAMTSYHKLWAIFWIALLGSIAFSEMGCVAFCGGDCQSVGAEASND